jgi:hypothetical protein
VLAAQIRRWDLERQAIHPVATVWENLGSEVQTQNLAHPELRILGGEKIK